MTDFNLKIGYPTILDIDAGSLSFKYIEVEEPNSLIYIGFALLDYDINFSLLKYNIKNQENNKLLTNVIYIERIKACDVPVKVICFVPEPGVYKAIWDNKFSWVNSKRLRIRISVLNLSDGEKIEEKKIVFSHE